MNINELNIGFVGTGRMATALAAGFTRGQISAEQIFGVDPSEASRAQFQSTVGESCTVSANPEGTLPTMDVIFLAVKPQIMEGALTQISEVLKPNQLIVSIAAGIQIAKLECWLPKGTRLIRVMPNTPCLVNAGASAVSRGTNATENDEQIVCDLMRSVGIVETVPEKLINAVTGVSGSGPAYVFQIIEALSDGGVKVGLPRDIATRLAAQTLLGAAQMVLSTGEHPGALKDAVTSPGGTTIAALHEMELGGVRAALMNAVEAATRRGEELA